jgi:nucleoside diphosphate kinase
MIDFIYDLLWVDYPGLQKALDPVTIALLVGQGVKYAGAAKAAKQQEAAALAQEQKGKDLYEQMVKDFESGKYDLSVAQSMRDAAEQQRILAEQASDAAAQRGEAQLQSSLAAARYGDPRTAALIPKQAQQIEQNIQQAELQGLAQKTQAEQQIAGLEQDVAAKNLALRQDLAAMQLQRGAAGMDAGELAKQQAKQAAIEAKYGAFAAMAQSPFAFMMEPQKIEIKEDGGKHKFSDKPGEVYMTGGEFDHSTNKKALIDEETGEKEAELTGGEAVVADGDNMLVFNPKQQNTIEGLVNKGDAKGLMRAMKRLLKQFNQDNV